MKKIFAALFLFGALLLQMPPLKAEAPTTAPLAYVVKLNSIISPAAYELVTRSLKSAAQENAAVVVLEMHTPGGLYDSTQQIVQAILDSPVPVVTYVSPSGSHAASAGTYILYSSHIAAMAPGTNLGAATPVQMGQNGAEKESPTTKTLEQKMTNDAAAYIRGLADLRGRNATWAEQSVRDAKSLTAHEALAQKVIDIIAADIPDLLAQIDGRNIKTVQGNFITLHTKGAAVRQITPDWRTELLEIIAHPNVAFILMTLGIYGLIYEFANPGSFVPGVTGSIFLLLGLYAMNVMPIDYAGLGLILVGMAFMIGEAFAPGFGALGIGGGIAFAAGAAMLFDSTVPGYGVDPALIGATTLFSFGLLSIILALAVKAQRKKPVTGIEELSAAIGEIVTWADGKGEVHVTGEIWQAESDTAGLKKGDKVEIVKIEGLRLIVAPHLEQPTKGD